MATSYNGWPAAPGWSVRTGQLQPLIIAGEPFSPGILAGDVHDVFEYVFTRVHNEVEPVVRPDWHQADDWGYNFRPNTNNPNQISCHGSATAGDYNATRHPNGRGGTWSPEQRAKILEILAAVDNVIRVLWGYDEMHFEICKDRAAVARAAAKVRSGIPSNPGTPMQPGPVGGIEWEQVRYTGPEGVRVLKLGSVGDDVAFVQRWHGIKDDGEYGPATEAKVRETQKRNELDVDGIVGPNTWRVMGIGGPPPDPEPWLKLPSVRSRPLSFQRWYNAYDFKPSLLPIIRPLANNFGPQSLAALKKVQARYGLVADGIDGPKTKKLLWSLGWRG